MREKLGTGFACFARKRIFLKECICASMQFRTTGLRLNFQKYHVAEYATLRNEMDKINHLYINWIGTVFTQHFNKVQVGCFFLTYSFDDTRKSLFCIRRTRKMCFNIICNCSVFSSTNILANIWDSLLNAARDMVSSIRHTVDNCGEVTFALFWILTSGT